MNQKTVNYIDDIKVRMVMTTLIIDVEKIIEKFGSIRSFDWKYGKGGATNGKIFLMAEMCQPAQWLEVFCLEALIPNGFVAMKDFVITYEKLVFKNKNSDYYLDPYLWRENPSCREMKSIKTLVTPTGNYIWHRDEYAEEFNCKSRMQYLLTSHFTKHHPDKLRFNPQIVEVADDKIVFGMRKHFGRFVLSLDKLMA